MGDALEASPKSVLDHLRRPIPGCGDLLTDDAGNTVSEIDPGRRNARMPQPVWAAAAWNCGRLIVDEGGLHRVSGRPYQTGLLVTRLVWDRDGQGGCVVSSALGEEEPRAWSDTETRQSRVSTMEERT